MPTINGKIIDLEKCVAFGIFDIIMVQETTV